MEKRKLSIALSELQGDQLADVLNIIAESLTNVNPDDDEEIELDVDQLDNNTLWRLREYCDNVANRTAFKAGAISKGGAVAAAAAGTGVGGLAGGGGATGAVSGAARAAQDNGKVAGTKPPARTESGSGKGKGKGLWTGYGFFRGTLTRRACLRDLSRTVGITASTRSAWEV